MKTLSPDGKVREFVRRSQYSDLQVSIGPAVHREQERDQLPIAPG